MLELTIKQVEKAIGEPAKSWESRCFEISSKIVKAGLLPKGSVAVYGHWLGKVHPSSLFYHNHRAIGFSRHGWCLLPDGTIVDPTRWVFEHENPYIYVGQEEDSNEFLCKCCGHCEEEHSSGFFRECDARNCNCPDFIPGEEWPYDEGGNRWREEHCKPPPKFSSKGKKVKIDFGKAEPFISKLLKYKGKTKTYAQLMWLANLPYEALEEYVMDIYCAFKKSGYGALIPCDNWDRSIREARMGFVENHLGKVMNNEKRSR